MTVLQEGFFKCGALGSVVLVTFPVAVEMKLKEEGLVGGRWPHRVCSWEAERGTLALCILSPHPHPRHLFHPHPG